MSRSDKLFQRLAELESQLLRELLLGLERAAETGDPAILTWVQPGHSMPTAFTFSSKPRPNVVSLVEDIEGIRSKLGEPMQDTPAYWYRQACFECINLDDHHRRGPRKIAADLAARLRLHDQSRG